MTKCYYTPAQSARACRECCEPFYAGSCLTQQHGFLELHHLLQEPHLHPLNDASSGGLCADVPVAPTFSCGNVTREVSLPTENMDHNIRQCALKLPDTLQTKTKKHNIVLTFVVPRGGGGPRTSLQDCVSAKSWESPWLSSAVAIRFRFVLIGMAGWRCFFTPKSSISWAWEGSWCWIWAVTFIENNKLLVSNHTDDKLYTSWAVSLQRWKRLFIVIKSLIS